jgi:hypothetical protein
MILGVPNRVEVQLSFYLDVARHSIYCPDIFSLLFCKSEQDPAMAMPYKAVTVETSFRSSSDKGLSKALDREWEVLTAWHNSQGESTGAPATCMTRSADPRRHGICGAAVVQSVHSSSYFEFIAY